MNRFRLALFAAMLFGALGTSHGQSVNPAGMDLLHELGQPAEPTMGTKHPDDPAASIRGLTPHEATPEKPADPLEQEALGYELMVAIHNDDVADAKRLIGQGAPVNARLPKTGMPPVLSARSPAMLRLLLESGASANAADEYGRTALHHMLFEQDAEQLLGLLLEHGANVNQAATLSGGETPLLAARELFFEGRDREHAAALMRLLIKAGADVNARDESGYSLLMTAAVNDKPDLARLALEYGADPSLPCNDGKTPLMRARELGHDGIADMLSREPGTTP